MLIALNLMLAAVIVGGITGVIVHAVRIQDDRVPHGLRHYEQQLRAAWAERVEERPAHAPLRPALSPARG